MSNAFLVIKQVDDYDALPYYPYRDDAILLHNVIWDYVREVLEGHYGKCSLIFKPRINSINIYYFQICLLFNWVKRE
jgi:hypothetical protein